MSELENSSFLLFSDLHSNLMRAQGLVNSQEDAVISLEFYHFDMKEKLSFYFSRLDAYEPNFDSLGVKPKMQWDMPKQSDFSKNFDFLKEAFAQKRSQKAVPVCFQKSKNKLEPEHISFFLTNWLENQKAKADIFFQSQEFSYIGFSPEYLYERRGNTLKTMALAGTRERNENYSPSEFLENPKDREEHQIVVNSLMKDLSPLGEVKTSETYIHDLKSLSHLRTDFEVELKQEVEDQKLIEILHPTPALGVYPKGTLKEWFSKHNQEQDRSFFGAPVLIRTKEYSKCIVGIRCLYQWKSQWQLGAGCGVVADSELSSEWNELKAKRESVLGALGLL